MQGFVLCPLINENSIDERYYRVFPVSDVKEVVSGHHSVLGRLKNAYHGVSAFIGNLWGVFREVWTPEDSHGSGVWNVDGLSRRLPEPHPDYDERRLSEVVLLPCSPCLLVQRAGAPRVRSLAHVNLASYMWVNPDGCDASGWMPRGQYVYDMSYMPYDSRCAVVTSNGWCDRDDRARFGTTKHRFGATRRVRTTLCVVESEDDSRACLDSMCTDFAGIDRLSVIVFKDTIPSIRQFMCVAAFICRNHMEKHTDIMFVAAIRTADLESGFPGDDQIGWVHDRIMDGTVRVYTSRIELCTRLGGRGRDAVV